MENNNSHIVKKLYFSVQTYSIKHVLIEVIEENSCKNKFYHGNSQYTERSTLTVFNELNLLEWHSLR